MPTCLIQRTPNVVHLCNGGCKDKLVCKHNVLAGVVAAMESGGCFCPPSQQALRRVHQCGGSREHNRWLVSAFDFDNKGLVRY